MEEHYAVHITWMYGLAGQSGVPGHYELRTADQRDRQLRHPGPRLEQGINFIETANADAW